MMEKPLAAKADIYTMNYDNLVWLLETVGEDWPFKTVVADEFTRLKSFRITQGSKRARALGRELMRRGLARVEENFGAVPVRIAAQAHLADFYGSLGFVRAGDPYDADGILHLDMLREPSASAKPMTAGT